VSIVAKSARPTADPRFSPSYPQRVHLKERPHWESVLRSWTERIAEFERSAAGSADARTLGQMHGALDQIADAARRLPGEVGDLYDEDKHKLEEAVHALERIFQQLGR
jgi:hypothetical protein